MAAKEKESKALPEGQAENPKKGSKVKRIVIILAILLITLSGAGIGGYWWFFMRTPSSANSAPAEAASADAAGKGAAGHAGAGSSGGAGGASGHAGAGGSGGAGGAGDGRIERQGDLPRSSGQVLPLPRWRNRLQRLGSHRFPGAATSRPWAFCFCWWPCCGWLYGWRAVSASSIFCRVRGRSRAMPWSWKRSFRLGRVKA